MSFSPVFHSDCQKCNSIWWLLIASLYDNISVQWNLHFNEPLFNEVLDITNDILCPGQSYSKMYGIEPRYNEHNPEAQTQNLPQYNELQCQHATEEKRRTDQHSESVVFCKQKLRVCSKVKIIATESHHA